MMWGYYGGMGWSWIIGLVVLLALLAVAIVLIVRLVPGARHSEKDADASASAARRILDERYARGELTTAEYQERLAALRER